MFRSLTTSTLMPMRNGMRLISDVVKGMRSHTVKPVEMNGVDAGSADGSPEFLEANSFTVRKISPQQFGHGKTKDLLASMASGDTIVFLNQDAIPVIPIGFES